MSIVIYKNIVFLSFIVDKNLDYVAENGMSKNTSGDAVPIVKMGVDTFHYGYHQMFQEFSELSVFSSS